MWYKGVAKAASLVVHVVQRRLLVVYRWSFKGGFLWYTGGWSKGAASLVVYVVQRRLLAVYRVVQRRLLCIQVVLQRRLLVVYRWSKGGFLWASGGFSGFL